MCHLILGVLEWISSSFDCKLCMPACPYSPCVQLQLNVLWSLAVERCMSVMQSGTQMIKLKRGTKGLVRLFYLDEHRTRLRWRPSRKSEKAKSKIALWILCFDWRNSFAWKYIGSAEQASWKLHRCGTVILLQVLESADYETINGNEPLGNGNPWRLFCPWMLKC